MLKLFSIIRTVLLCCMIPVLLLSCVPRPSLPPDCREHGFEAEILWQYNDVTLCGTVTAEIPSDGAQAEITSLRFSHPEALQDVLLLREEGSTTLLCHGMTADASLFSVLWSTAEWLTAEGALRPVFLTEEGDRELLYAQLPLEDGTYYEWYLDPKSGVPKEIRYGKARLEILSFVSHP